MFTYEFLHIGRAVRSRYENSGALFKLLSALVVLQDGLMTKLSELGEGGAAVPQKAADVIGLIRKIPGLLDVPPEVIFREIDLMARTLDATGHQVEGDKAELLHQLSSDLRTLASLYGEVLMRRGSKVYVEFLFHGQQVFQRLNTVAATFVLLEKALDGEASNSQPRDAEGTLTILLPESTDLITTLTKFAAIQNIYSELCLLLNVSEVSYPLRISKIEAGSLWGKFFGHSRILDLLADFIREGARYLYRNFTTEGRLGSIPSKLEILDSALEFSKKLRDHGLDTDALDNHVVKAGVLISQQLTALLVS